MAILIETNTKPDRPYWLWALITIGIACAAFALADGRYGLIFETLLTGLGTTVLVAVCSYALALLLGLLLALASRSKTLWLRQAARFYIEIVRGLPALVILLYVTFVGAPLLINAYQWTAQAAIAAGWFPDVQVRDISNLVRGIVALAFAYSAFLAEVFRAGLDSIDKSQSEAAYALGLSRWQTFRLVLWPQAVRKVLPVLGNDFIAMVKDSSLVSVLGVNDITQLGKLYASSSFLTVETYNTVAALYLLLTVSLSLLLRKLEQHWRAKGYQKD
ncbi:amino acid ABC transporter permease [Curvibacter sp. CHRR-16]|uniref:amino acid ABC transporter permease n=1 Tax=Curvibacter sp. CHRR-16 TaxID=2835872 RepID=UPI001BD9C40B|nr:amino acid ABC transporter permease [Curvibacter sp. CHRR-16]MBT0570255.1 amino acid ABC transporter permease [Curvibacter sp. CHRR-16]